MFRSHRFWNTRPEHAALTPGQWYGRQCLLGLVYMAPGHTCSRGARHYVMGRTVPLCSLGLRTPACLLGRVAAYMLPHTHRRGGLKRLLWVQIQARPVPHKAKGPRRASPAILY